MKRKGSLKIASLSPIQLQKLRDYEKEMGVILVAYEKQKEVSRQGHVNTPGRI